MPAPRLALNEAAIADPSRANQRVYVYRADENGRITSTLLTLYDAPTGNGALANPQTLDSEGKWSVVPYVDDHYIIRFNSPLGEHSTGVTWVPGFYRGAWGPATLYHRGDTIQVGDAAVGGAVEDGDIYYALIDHTSGTNFEADLSAGKWLLYVRVGAAIAASDLAQDWATKTTGSVDGVEFSSKEYAQGTQVGAGGSAKEWAQRAHGSTVPGGGGEFSAKHYATEAAGSLSDATAQATLAGAYATAAGVSAGQAASSAADAQSSEDDAEVSQIAAAASAAAAAASANSLNLRTVETFSGNRTVADADRNKLLVYTGTGGHTVDWDNGALSAQTEFVIYHDGSGNLTLDPAGVQTIDGATTLVLTNHQGVAVARKSATESYAIWTRGYGIFTLPVVIEGSSSSAALRVTQTGSGDVLLLEDSANPDSTPVVVDASGRAVFGYSAVMSFTGYTPGVQVLGTGNSDFGVGRFTNDANSAIISILKSRGTTPATHGIVSSGDIVGVIDFKASDGTNYRPAASISVRIDGTPGTDDMPGRLVMATTPDGSNAAVESLRIDNNGKKVNSGTSAKTFAGSVIPDWQAIGADASRAGFGAAAYVATAVGASFNFAKSRNATLGSHTIVQSGDTIGSINWGGSNGSSFDLAVQIVGEVGGTPGASADMPGRLRIKVAPDGSATPADALVVNPDKTLQLPGYGAGTLVTDSSGNVTAGSANSIRTISANDTLVAGDNGNTVRINASGLTIATTAAATLGAGWRCRVITTGDYNDLFYGFINPNGAEQIDDQDLVCFYMNEAFDIYCDGTQFRTTRVNGLVFFGEIAASGTTIDFYQDSVFLDDPEMAGVRVLQDALSNDTGSRNHQIRVYGSGAVISSSDYDMLYANAISTSTITGGTSANGNAWDLSGRSWATSDANDACYDVMKCITGSRTLIFGQAMGGNVASPGVATGNVNALAEGLRWLLSSSGSWDAGTIRLWGYRCRRA